jgi:hypothetical protein
MSIGSDIDLLKANINDTFDKWILGPTFNEEADKWIHWATVAVMGGLSAWFTLHSWSTAADNTGGLTAGPVYARLMNWTTKVLSPPNIEGVTVYSSTQKCTRDIEVSETMLIGSKGSSGGKEYVTDNAAPHPREWQISGYIMSLRGFPDEGLIVKPSLVFQLYFLDRLASVRAPVWFKPHYNLFVHVLITNFSYEFEPHVMNGVKVDLTLREFVPYEVDSLTATLTAVVEAAT